MSPLLSEIWFCELEKLCRLPFKINCFNHLPNFTIFLILPYFWKSLNFYKNGSNSMTLFEYYTNIDCSWGEWWKIIASTVKFNLGLLFTEARRSKVNNKPRLNFTKCAIIFYHSPIERAVNICFKHPIHRFFRATSSKFGSCKSFFESRGNSKN